MTAYEASEWADLFVATAGAAAALAGLVFVAVSINLERILALPGIPERALQTVMMLSVVVVISIAALIPGQSHVALGIELLLISAVYLYGVTRASARAALDPDRPESDATRAARTALLAAGTLPLVIGSVSLLAEAGGGLYWVVAGITAAIVGGVANAWVLLVEIQR